jgi:hypothetical protein
LITPLDEYMGGSGGAGTGATAGTDNPSGGTGLSSGFAGAEDGGEAGGGRAGGTTGVGGGGGWGAAGAGTGADGAGGKSGAGGKAGSDPGGMGGEAGDAGESGESGGGSGGAGTGGGGNGGSAGGGAGGTLAGGGAGGSSGNAGGGTGGCAGANFDTDPLNCGECGNECESDELCDEGDCVVSPCAGLCETRKFLQQQGLTYRADTIGQPAQCFETTEITKETVKITCWNLQGRSLSINDEQDIACNVSGLPLTTEKRNGGYCAQLGPAVMQETNQGFLLE